MNFTGAIAYREPQPNLAPARDSGTVTKNPPTGLARGWDTADYNVVLRGAGKRIDRKKPS